MSNPLETTKFQIFWEEMESEFPGNIHIHTLCPKYLQSFTKFLAAVTEDLPLKSTHSIGNRWPKF